MNADDRLLQEISRLPALAPDRTRSERVRAACKSRLAPRLPGWGQAARTSKKLRARLLVERMLAVR